MKLSIPYKVRAAIYIITGVGSPVVAYLLAREYIGELEVALWSAEVLFASLVAGLNVTKDE